jgi:hypothetical protein
VAPGSLPIFERYAWYWSIEKLAHAFGEAAFTADFSAVPIGSSAMGATPVAT